MKEIDEGEVAYRSEECVFVELLDDGKVELSIYMSSECDMSADMNAVIGAWSTGSAYAVIEPRFSIASPVDYLVEGHSMPRYGNAIDESARPVFDAVRRELVQQIERIDALTFKAIPKE